MNSDVRMKCRKCRQWMRSGTPTARTPARRREAPHASRCTDCPADHYACGCPESVYSWEKHLAQEAAAKKG